MVVVAESIISPAVINDGVVAVARFERGIISVERGITYVAAPSVCNGIVAVGAVDQNA